MTVIVLDTNAMPRGQFSRPALDTLKNVAGRGASIVIPEIVIWEWAEHAHSAHVALEEAIKGYRVDAGVMARPTIASAPPVEILVERIEASLPGDVRVWRPQQAAWRTAVREQVLQVGSGETKSGVKTGAADGIVLACVEHESDHAESVVVLITDDKQLRRNAARENVRFASGAGGLPSVLRTFVPATDDLAVRLMERLPEYLNERFGDYGEILAFREYGVAIDVEGEYRGPDSQDGLSSLFIMHVDIAEIDDLRVETDGEERLGLAELRMFGDILGEVVTYHEVTPGEMGATRQTVNLSSQFIDVTVAVRWDQNWLIEDVVPTGVAVLVIVGPDEEEVEGEVPRFRARAAK